LHIQQTRRTVCQRKLSFVSMTYNDFYRSFQQMEPCSRRIC